MRWPARWLYKACPRCHGDCYLEHEEGEVTAHCLQCGFEGFFEGRSIQRAVPPTEVLAELGTAAA
jgi:hypothetical protein